MEQQPPKTKDLADKSIIICYFCICTAAHLFEQADSSRLCWSGLTLL